MPRFTLLSPYFSRALCRRVRPVFSTDPALFELPLSGSRRACLCAGGSNRPHRVQASTKRVTHDWSDDQSLAERMCMPCRPRAGLESDARTASIGHRSLGFIGHHATLGPLNERMKAVMDAVSRIPAL